MSTDRNTTKPLPPNEDLKYTFERGVQKLDTSYYGDQKKLTNLIKLKRLEEPFSHYNFVKSIFGEIRHYTKLSAENVVKNHCLDACYKKEGSQNMHQSEKLCLVNCAAEANSFLHGLAAYKEIEYYHIKSNRNYSVDKAVPIKKI